MTGRASTTNSSSFHYHWTYDVFISFRGEDTRYGFTGNLNHALTQKGVRTFFDDKEIRKGDEITPKLLKAIKESRMAIIVFSENYASSTFCLDELVQICQCIKHKDRLVWPIFYNVEPSEVRHQKEKYGQALATHTNNLRASEEKIQSWKLALYEVSNISGTHFNTRHDYEYQVVERIVKDIFRIINRALLHIAEYPVGLDSRLQNINSLLQLGLKDEVIMVGICGMGGVGKTTIARALYNSVADNFEGLCFLHDIRENQKKIGLEQMQERMLSKILGVDIKIDDVNEGIAIIKERLKQKKILLILDNVYEHEQLRKFAGSCDWFGPGSRIVITTRDKRLLVRHGVERTYDMEAFNYEESFELLRWNAFKTMQVDPSFKEVVDTLICYAQGLPLALEVVGSHLCGMRIREWESALSVYERIPQEDIQNILKTSYDGLTQVEKETFLDIACFLKGNKLEYVEHMVKHAHDFDPHYAIQVLVDKCLIKIQNDCFSSKFSCIEMHDLIQNMGREIVRQESPYEAGKRSRLWFHQDIIDIFEKNTGTNKVRMIVQDNWSECIEVNWDGEAFKSMKELKILIFKNVKFSEDLKYLPESLKVLKWKGYPSSCLPPTFSPKKLVVLDIGYSRLSSLETIIKVANILKEIPDLSNLRNLKELSFWDCKNLIEIHDSIGYLPKLEILNACHCVRLKTFPRAIKLPSLTQLNLGGCSSLTYFPEILENAKIQWLFLNKTRIGKLPWSICNLSELRVLEINQEEEELVIEIPNSIFLLPEIEDLKVLSKGTVISCNLKEGQEHAIWSKQCPNRVAFKLPRCNISDDLLRTDLCRFMNVTYLDLSGNDFTILPAWMKECHFLEKLVLDECRHLREVEGIPPNIRWLEARNCVSLSLESKSIILSEQLHGAPGRYDFDSVEENRCFFWVPSRSIPKWFDHRSKGASISFWLRNSFPTLCLCLLFKAGYVESGYCFFYVRVNINEEPTFFQGLTPVSYKSLKLDEDHLVVYSLKEDDIRTFIGEQLCLEEDRWYHAQACVRFNKGDNFNQNKINKGDNAIVIEESGMYVIKELCEMEDISFTNPYHQTLDFTWGRQEQVGTRMEEKEVAINKKRGLMGDDNFASSSTAFISTKRARNRPINLNDFDAITPQVPFDLASTEASWADLDFYTTSLPMLPSMGYACDTFGNQDDEWLSLRPCWETSLYNESTNLQELQQQKDATSTNIEQVPKSFEDTRKAKGKEIVINDDTINE